MINPFPGLRPFQKDESHLFFGRENHIREIQRKLNVFRFVSIGFGPFFRLRRELPSPFDARPRYRVTIEDHFWHWLYLPVVALAERIARVVGLMQQGRIGTYLLYSFVTLLVTLLVVKR